MYVCSLIVLNAFDACLDTSSAVEVVADARAVQQLVVLDQFQTVHQAFINQRLQRGEIIQDLGGCLHVMRQLHDRRRGLRQAHGRFWLARGLGHRGSIVGEHRFFKIGDQIRIRAQEGTSVKAGSFWVKP